MGWKEVARSRDTVQAIKDVIVKEVMITLETPPSPLLCWVSCLSSGVHASGLAIKRCTLESEANHVDDETLNVYQQAVLQTSRRVPNLAPKSINRACPPRSALLADLYELSMLDIVFIILEPIYT